MLGEKNSYDFEGLNLAGIFAILKQKKLKILEAKKFSERWKKWRNL